MPAPRSVLIDIHELGLDPAKPHSDVNASGRLKRSVETKPESVVVSKLAAVEKVEVLDSQRGDDEESGEQSTKQAAKVKSQAVKRDKPASK